MSGTKQIQSPIFKPFVYQGDNAGDQKGAGKQTPLAESISLIDSNAVKPAVPEGATTAYGWADGTIRNVPEQMPGAGETPTGAMTLAPGAAKYGMRVDGSIKGEGYFGALKRPDGSVSSEISVGMNLDGKETLFPALVPTLNKKEVDYLLSNDPSDQKIWATSTGRKILNKAVRHAMDRIADGKSPFATDNDSATTPPGQDDQPGLSSPIFKPFTYRGDAAVDDDIEPEETGIINKAKHYGGKALDFLNEGARLPFGMGHMVDIVESEIDYIKQAARADWSQWAPADAARVMWMGAKVIPDIIKGTYQRLERGGKNVPAPGEAAADPIEQSIAEAQKVSAELIAKAQELGEDGFLVPGITIKDLAQFPQNAGFSVLAGASGLLVGAPVAFLPVLGGRPAAYAAGTYAAGQAAFKMDKDMFLTDMVRDPLNAYVRKTQNRDMTAEEWKAISAKFEHAADMHALWEAIPEAIGQAATMALWKLPVGEFFKVPGVKNRMIKTLAKAGLAYTVDTAQELAMETITQKGQAHVEHGAGLRDDEPTWTQAFKEVAPSVVILQSVMGPLAGGAHLAAKGGGMVMEKAGLYNKGGGGKPTVDNQPMTGKVDIDSVRQSIDEESGSGGGFKAFSQQHGPMGAAGSDATSQASDAVQSDMAVEQADQAVADMMQAAMNALEAQIDAVIPDDGMNTAVSQTIMAARKAAAQQFFGQMQSGGAMVSGHRINLLPAPDGSGNMQVVVTKPDGQAQPVTDLLPPDQAAGQAMAVYQQLRQLRERMPALDQAQAPPAQAAQQAPTPGPAQAPATQPQQPATPQLNPDDIWQMTPGGLTDMWGQAVSRIDAVETENQALIEKLDKQLDSLRGKKGKGFTEARKRIKATRDRLLQETGNLSETAGRQFSQAIMGAAIERAMADGVTDEQVGSFIRQFSAGVQPGKAEGNFTIEDVYQSVIKGLKASSEEASSRSDSVINADVSDDSVVADDDAGTPPAPPGKPPVTTGAPAAPAGGSDGNGGSGNKNSGSDNENDRNGNDGVPEEPSDKDQDQAFEVAMAQAEEMAREANEKGPVAGQGVENRDEVRVTLEDIENRFRESTPGLTDEQYRQIALTADRHPISGIAGKASKHTFIDAVAKTLKKGQAMILYEIDLDWFKAINDSLGHSAGDQVMQHAQRLLRDLLKGFEIMHYHYGGDEGGGAMVVSDGKEAISQAIQAFKAARDAVNNLQFYAPNGKIMRVSMSMGVSMIGSGVSADSVLIAGKETQQKNSIFIDKSLKDNYDLDNDIGHDYTSDYAPNGVLPGKRPGDANDQNTSDNSDPGGNPPGQDNSGGGSGRGTGDDAGGTASGPGDRSAVAPGGSDPSIQSSTPQEDQEVAPPSSDPDGPSSKPTNDAASQTDSTRAATSDDLDSAKGKPPGKIPRENTQETISPEELVLSEGQVGKSGTVYLPDNTPVGFTYALVDLWDLILSNNNDFTPNSDFPEELQPRGRDREAMRVQVIQMSENLVPEKLGASPSVGSGAPIVGPDGVVESGNGRAMAIRRAYDTANADGYASWLIDNADEFGIDGEELDAMEMPVLVRVRSTGVSNRNEFVRQANEGEVAAMSPLEQAESDALMLDETDMSIFAPSEEGQINIAANRPFIVKFLNKLGIAARAEYVTADGEYTRQLVDRVEAAVFHKAYVNRALTELVAESTDPEIKNILKGMLVAAGKFAKVRNLAEARNGIETLDNIGIIRDLTDAVEFIRMAKKEHNMAISKAVNNKRTQGDLFSIPLTKSADLAVDAMVEMIRSGKRQGEFFSNLADALKKYLDDVLNYGNDLTGETPEFNSLEEIRNARRKASGPQIDPDPDPLMGYARRDNKSDGEDQPGSSERSAAYHTQETDGALVNEPPPARKPEQLEFDFAFSTQEAESQPAQARRSGELIASQTTLISTTGYIHAANTRLDGDGDAASLISHIRRYAQENAYLIIVDADGNVLEVFHHTKGLKASSQIDSTDLAGHVFNVPGAAKVYFVHNHPSGHTEPSENDMMIADGIQLTLDARGIKMSSLILGGTEYTTFSPVGYGMARKIRPVLRKIKVPKKEKTRIVLHGPQQLKQANSPREAMAIIVDDYGNQDGILLLDSKNQAVGFLTMPTGMPVAEAVSEVVAAACITNARAMVFNSNEPMSYGSRQAFATGLVQGFHESWQLTLFDVFEKGRSLADQNRLPQVPPRDAPRVLNKEAVGGKTLYTTETGNTDAITTDQAMDAFSRFNPDEIYEENGNIILRKSGRELVVEMADNIDLDEGEFMAGYRRAPKPGEEAQGEYTPGRIRLKKGKADKWVLDHESFHWLREAGFISNKDYLALKKGAKAAYGINNLADVTEEDVANFVADKLESRDLAGHNKGLASALQKIFDLVDGFINLMGYRTAGGVVRDIESGAIADKADMDHGDDLSARVTVYHGTNKDIDVNDLSPEFTGQNINGSTQAKGIYFSNHKDTAEGYAEYEQITGGSEKLGKILETIINTDNLKVIKTNDIITEKQAAPIREQGYDGVWKQGIDGSAGHDEFILFNKKPIAADKKYSTGQPDPRLAPAKKTMADSLRDALKALDPRVAWQKYAGDPIWKFFSETGPEAVGRKIEFIDKINRGIITDYRLDDEFIALRDETEQMIRQAREKAKELARIIATFPRAEQIRIGQVIEGSITNMPKRYEAALKVAEEFKRLEGDLQDLGLLGQDHRFRQLTRKEIAGKFDEIAELERQIVKLQNQLKPHIEVTRARGRRVAEAISEIVTEDVIEDSKSGGNVETRLHRAVQLNEERVKEALLHRGFSDGEADQMIRRVKESVIAPAEDTPSAASSSTTEIRKTIVKTIERKVIETITEQKTKTYSKTVMARARGSIVKEINQLRKKQAEILSRIQTHYKMSGKQYLRLAYDTEKSESAFLASLRHYAKNARLKKGYSHQRKELDPEWRWNHRKATPELVMKGLSEETHDVELMRMFSAIAGNDKWAVPANMWNAYMDDDPATYGNFKPMSPSDKLGPLAGMMVDPYIYDYLNATIDQRNELGRMYDELLRLWKTGKVVYNPASQCRNIMSGIILADMGDLSPHRLDIYAKAAAALKTQNDVYKAAYKHGALGTEWAGHEIKSFLEEAERLNQGEGSMLSNSVRLIKRLADMPGRSYQGIEQFFKLAMFIDQREKGATDKQAAAHALKWCFDYTKIPSGIKWAKRWYSPFITFTYKAMPRMAETAVRKPWKMAKYAMLFYAVEALTRRLRGESEEEEDREKRVLPDYMRRTTLPGMPSHLRVPITDKYGRSKYLDLSYILPWGDIGEMWGQSRIKAVPRAFLPSHPLYVTVAEVGFDTIMFTGQPLTKEWMNTGDYSKELGKEVWRQAMPSLAGSYSWNKLMAAAKGEKDWAGRDRSFPEAVFDVFLGVKLRSVDYHEQLEWRMKEKREAIQQLEHDFTREYRRIHIQAPSNDLEKQREREREMYEKFGERTDAILEQITEIIE